MELGELDRNKLSFPFDKIEYFVIRCSDSLALMP